MSSGFVLELNNISKNFPGVKALDSVDFKLLKGEIHGLVGENGAGKSTLIKIISGAYTKDSGKIIYMDNEVEISSPRKAIELGIVTIYQELSVVPSLSVAQNIFLSVEPVKAGFYIDRKKINIQAKKILDRMKCNISVREIVGNLSISQQQLVEIARALSYKAKIIIMDEPTTALNRRQIDVLFNMIRNLKTYNVTIIFISHNIEEVLEITDRITVLRDGKKINNVKTKETSKNEIIQMMIGHILEEKKIDKRIRFDSVALEVKNLYSSNGLKNINFKLHKGEILGIYGLLGAGRTELLKTIFGIDIVTSGKIYLEGKEIKISSTERAISKGISLLTENRREEGLILGMSINDNITLPILSKFSRFMWYLDKKKQKLTSLYFKDKFSIKTPSISRIVDDLSGGNQQKVILSRWLATNPKILMLDEPTIGIDVGSKEEILNIISDLSRRNNFSIILSSSEINEIMWLCDRILIMKNKTIFKELVGNEISSSSITKSLG